MTNSRTLNCFVISPIGAESSDTRTHADTVYECIIQPACQDSFGQDGPTYQPQRGDHKAEPGKITDQIYEEILRADLIIAVLTESNPNVYYELAVAQSAAKPVILLLEKGFEAPFDIKDQRIIYYDFDPRSIFNGTYAQQLRLAINTISANPRRPVVPFAPHLVPLGNPVQTIGDRASEGEFDTIDMVRSARRYIHLMGYTLNGWLMNESFKRALEDAAAQTREINEVRTGKNGSAHKTDVSNALLSVKVLIMAPDNPALGVSMKSSSVALQVQSAAEKIATEWRDYLSTQANMTFGIEMIASQNLGYQAIITEGATQTIPYLVARDTIRSPYIWSKRGSAYYSAMKEEFEFLWERSTQEPTPQAKPAATKQNEPKKKPRTKPARGNS